MSFDALTERVLRDVTIDGAGWLVLRRIRSREVAVIINVINPPAGSSPTLTFTLTQVDPGDEATSMGASFTTLPISSVGVHILNAGGLVSPVVRLSWEVSSGAVFPTVGVTLVDKEATSRQNPFASLVKFECYPTEELRADDVKAGDRFHGRALSGTATSSTAWEIVRFYRSATGDVLRLIYRTGTSWDDRLTVS